MPRKRVFWGPKPGQTGLTTRNALPCEAVASQAFTGHQHLMSTYCILSQAPSLACHKYLIPLSLQSCHIGRIIFISEKKKLKLREGRESVSSRPYCLEGADLSDFQVLTKQSCVPGHLSLVWSCPSPLCLRLPGELAQAH